MTVLCVAHLALAVLYVALTVLYVAHLDCHICGGVADLEKLLDAAVRRQDLIGRFHLRGEHDLAPVVPGK